MDEVHEQRIDIGDDGHGNGDLKEAKHGQFLSFRCSQYTGNRLRKCYGLKKNVRATYRFHYGTQRTHKAFQRCAHKSRVRRRSMRQQSRFCGREEREQVWRFWSHRQSRTRRGLRHIRVGCSQPMTYCECATGLSHEGANGFVCRSR
jgi:hypothetical protein